jgi:hypothetical protein
MKFIGCETSENGMDQRLKNLNRQKSLPAAKSKSPESLSKSVLESPMQKEPSFAGLGTIRESEGNEMEDTL